MYKNKIISKILALLLLILFVVGNSPIQLLHNAFANHKDYSYGSAQNNAKPQVVQKGFHCDCDHFVVESAFVIPIGISNSVSTWLVLEFPTSLISPLFSPTHSFFQLRGPPAIV